MNKQVPINRAFTPEFYDDFVARLNFDRQHNNAGTADPIWTVQEKVKRKANHDHEGDGALVYCGDSNYSSVWAFHSDKLDLLESDGECQYVEQILKSNHINMPSTDEVDTVVEIYDDGEEPTKEQLIAAWASFEGSINDHDFIELVDDQSGDFGVWHYQDCYKTASIHLTLDGAKHHMERKSHELRDPKTYVQSAYWSFEFKSILNGLADGTLVHVDSTKQKPDFNKKLFIGLIASTLGLAVCSAALVVVVLKHGGVL